MASSDGAPIIIKKYANRRLYDTSASRYVTLDHLRELVKANKEFQVVDAKSGEDLTRGVLAQIIFEEESKGETLLPVEFLRQLISFYGDSMQSMVPGYLNMTMESFARQQAEMRDKMAGAMTDPAASMALMEEAAKRNMAMFQQAMKMFAPGFPSASGEASRDAGDGAWRCRGPT